VSIEHHISTILYLLKCPALELYDLMCNSAPSWQYHISLPLVGIFSGSFIPCSLQLDSALCCVFWVPVSNPQNMPFDLVIYLWLFSSWEIWGVSEIHTLQWLLVHCRLRMSLHLWPRLFQTANLLWPSWITAFPSFQLPWHVSRGKHYDFTVFGYQDIVSGNLCM